MSDTTSAQPDVTPENPAVIDILIEELLGRKQLGMERYGVPLYPFNGRDMLQESLEEALDHVVYTRAAMLERAAMQDKIYALQDQLEEEREENQGLRRQLSMIRNVATNYDDTVSDSGPLWFMDQSDVPDRPLPEERSFVEFSEDVVVADDYDDPWAHDPTEFTVTSHWVIDIYTVDEEIDLFEQYLPAKSDVDACFNYNPAGLLEGTVTGTFWGETPDRALQFAREAVSRALLACVGDSGICEWIKVEGYDLVEYGAGDAGNADDDSDDLVDDCVDCQTPMEMVEEFHDRFSDFMNLQPVTWPSLDVVELRLNLIREEKDELEEAVANLDIVETVDALADMVYVIYGFASGLGVDLDEVLKEVHRSNMTKLDENGNPIFRSDGKILKSDLFEEPRLAEILLEQSGRSHL